MGREFLFYFLARSCIRSCLVFQLPGLVPVPVSVWSAQLGRQSGGTPQIRDLPISSSHLGLPHSAPQCRLFLLTFVDILSGSRPNSLLMLTTKRLK